MSPNPYAPPANARVAGPLRFVDAESLPAEPALGMILVDPLGAKGQQQWRLLLGHDELWLAPPQGPAAAFTHEEFAQHANILVGGSWILLLLKDLGPIKQFKLPSAARGTFGRWLAPKHELYMQAEMKRNLKLSLPLGIVWVVLALPLGDRRWDLLGLLLGATLIVLSLFAPRRPHPFWFLGLALNWFLFAATGVRSVVIGSTWMVVMALLGVFAGIQALRAFGFYKQVRAIRY